MTDTRSSGFGDLLRRYRQAIGLTQEELAERATLSARAISELERGARQYPYRTTMQLLAKALLLSPQQLAEFEQAGRRPAAPRGPQAVAAAATESGAQQRIKHKHNLPAQLTSFVGRGAALGRIREGLLRDEVRLLTLTGPPGSGKTRLSIEVGASLLAEFEDGVFLVELAAVNEPERVASAIAGTLGVKEITGSTPADGLTQSLKAKELLLVLDNFEQVLDAAPLVGGLLQACPRLKVLVTSRERLHLRVEKEFPVPPLTMPEPNRRPPLRSLGQYEAVQLFVERARDTNPDFELTEENAEAVAAITRRLDGLPLALELAAARTRIFSPEALLGRLQSSLELLTGGDKDLPARQQTLRAAIAWSHDLLDASEKDLFRNLGVFAGGCTLEAIEAICGRQRRGIADGGPPAAGSATLARRTLDSVESLVGKSLLQQRRGQGQEPRFALLETIREYAREKLAGSAQLEELRQRHALYFLAMAEQMEPSLWTQEATEGLRNLEHEHENLRAVLEWASKDHGGDLRAKSEIGLRLCAATWRFWDFKGYLSEGRRWLEAALEQDRTRDPAAYTEAEHAVLDRARAWALVGAGSMAGDQGEYETARARMVESLSLSRKLGYRWGIMAALLTMVTQVGGQGDYATARIYVEEVLSISRELGDKQNTAYALNILGGLFQMEGDPATARAILEESLAINRELKSTWGIAGTLIYLGELAYEQAQLAQARALFQESLIITRKLENKWDIALALRGLASVALEQDDLAHAQTLCQEGLGITRDLGEKRGIAHCLAILAGIAARRGPAARRAAVLAGATGALLEATNTTLWTMQQRIYEQAATTARNLLGEAAFEAARHEGSVMSMQQAVSYALEEEGRGEGPPHHTP
jgi:predicted ATPase/transcriptional regulator with XRE-family HTH domain